MRLAVAALAAASALSLAPPAGARTLDVRPGKDAIAKALKRAEPGDTLRIHEGRYREGVEITKRVSLVGAPGERRPRIDGRCRTGETIAVRRSRVELRRLKVAGADEGFGVAPSAVTFVGVARGVAAKLRVHDTCDAEYGINVFDTGPILIRDSHARGFSDAGFYVGSITATKGGTIRVIDSEAIDNNRGVIVEETEPGHVAVGRNVLARNRESGLGPPTGIWLHSADGVRIFENAVQGNGEYGIHLDPDSDRNRVRRNEVRNNPVDLLNEGNGNCGSENFFEREEGQPLGSC